MDPRGSIPIIELWGRLLVPLQGDVSDSQMEALEQAVLERIRDRGPEGLVLDCSGIQMMDSHLCAVLGRMARASRLMGTRPVLSGMAPGIVMTLEMMGIEMKDVETCVNLEDALVRLGVVAHVNHDERDVLRLLNPGD
jgi:rsbT antagonist protein RsbS